MLSPLQAVALGILALAFIILGEMSFHINSRAGKSGWLRLLEFIEQPFFLVVLSIVGGIVGIIVYAPVFLICDVCILLALHRSGAVADKKTIVQIFWYAVTLIVTSAILSYVGILLRNSARNFVRDTTSAIVEALKPKLVEPPVPPPTQTPPQPQQEPEQPEVRTHVEFDGNIRLPQDIAADGHNWGPERNFKEGETLHFNYFIKAFGHNPVQVHASSQWIYLEPDASEETQKKVVRNFKQRIARNWKAHPEYSKNATPLFENGNGQWNSIFTAEKQDEDGPPRLVTHQDLEDFKLGTVIVFVLVQVPYEDNGKWHYLRTCQYLVPPATIQKFGIFAATSQILIKSTLQSRVPGAPLIASFAMSGIPSGVFTFAI